MLLKELNSLQERIFLSVPRHFVVQVCTNGETVLHTTVQIELIRLAGLLEDLLGLMSLLRREDGVGFSSADGQRSLDF